MYELSHKPAWKIENTNFFKRNNEILSDSLCVSEVSSRNKSCRNSRLPRFYVDSFECDSHRNKNCTLEITQFVTCLVDIYHFKYLLF